MGITKSEINASGELVLTYSNGDVKNLGKVTGEDGANGANGADGRGIKSLTLSPDGELVVVMSDNSISTLGNIKGEKGDKGLQGEKGADGRGIADTAIVNGELVIYYTDGTEKNLGIIGSTTVDSLQMLKFTKLDDGTLSVAIKNDYRTVATDIVIPSSFNGMTVTAIADGGFTDCTSLERIKLPDSIVSIGFDAFDSCAFEYIDLPDTVNSIGIRCFDSCINLKSIIIPEGVTVIKDNCFSGCAKLSNVTLPQSLTSIGGYAFYKCTSLTEITIPENVNYIGLAAFKDSGLTKAYFEDTTTWGVYYTSADSERYTGDVSKTFSNPTEAATQLKIYEKTGSGNYGGYEYKYIYRKK